MSSFKAKVKCRTTGDIVDCWFIDDYFGRHEYGYIIDEKALTYEEFCALYERV